MAFQKKVNSTTTEAVLGQASASLKKGVIELKAATGVLETLETKAEELTLTIVSKEEKIKELDVVYAEKARQHDVEFGLKVKEDTLKTVKEVLALHKLMTIPEQELEDLRKGLSDCETEQDTRVKAEVAKASGAIAGNYDQRVKLLEAEYRAKEAGNLARIENLTSQVESYKHSIEEWKGQLDAERKASVERAKAGSIGTLNVGAQEAGRR